jgi:hypothetical protein
MAGTKAKPRIDLLHPAFLGLFLVLSVAWLVFGMVPDPTSPGFRAVSRVCGYLAALAMLVPYLHIARRFFRYRHFGDMTRWLRWHIGAAYLAFALALIHCRGRSNGWLTLSLLWLFWIVMISGVVGFYGQKLLYLLLPFLVKREMGMERLEPQRLDVLEQAEKQAAELLGLAPEDISDKDWPRFCAALLQPGQAFDHVTNKLSENEREALAAEAQGKTDPKHKAAILDVLNKLLKSKDFGAGVTNGPAQLPQAIAGLSQLQPLQRNRLLLETLCPQQPVATKEFVIEALLRLRKPVSYVSWLWPLTRDASVPAPLQNYDRLVELATPKKADILKQLRDLIEERRQLEIEYWCHRLGRVWLLFHGPAAAALFIILIEHIAMSMWYGGF